MKKNLIESLRKSALGTLLDLDSLALLSEKANACPLQDPFRIRARFLGWKVASLLLDEKGNLKKESLRELTHAFENESYPVGWQEGDVWIFQHLFSCLQKLEKNDAIWQALKKCSLPICGRDAEEIIRDTLWPDKIESFTNTHIRRAALTAWLTLLRQMTGSCFATAPAMLIQREDPVRMIQDLDAIISAGELRRGSYAAPLNKSLSPGDLQKPIGFYPASLSPGLLAAFQEAQIPFPEVNSPTISSKQLLEESLLVHFGLSQKDLKKETASLSPQFGVLWERQGGHYSGASSKALDIHSWEKSVKKAKHAFLAVADCALLRSWEYTLASFCDVKVEFSHWNLFTSLGMHPETKPPGIGAFLLLSIQAKLDAANHRIKQISHEHQRAVQAVHARERLLGQTFSSAEQIKLRSELYAELHTANNLVNEIEKEGHLARWLSQFFSHFLNEANEKLQKAFQEVFDPSLNADETERFEDSPAGFRLLYKSGRSAAASWERIEEESQFVNAVYKFFESLESQYPVDPNMKNSFTLIMTELLQYIRSEEFISGALERSQESRNAKQAKPWAYRSGGTMQTLLQNYYELPTLPQEFSRKIRTPLELYDFIREAAKKATHQQHLMISPTHAFLFFPSLIGSDEPLEKGIRFVKTLSISPIQSEFLIERLAEYLPPDKRASFHFACRQKTGSQSVNDLRSLLLSGWLAANQPDSTAIDTFLYEALPLFTPGQASQALERMSLHLKITMPKVPNKPILLSLDLIRIMKEALIEAKGPLSSTDWDLLLADAARQEGVVYPSPAVFADTNWSDWLFGIVVNPATREPELWRLSRTGLTGAPMSEWNHLFLKEGRWAIFL